MMASKDIERADHACKACKSRKKACDKLLPACSACVHRKVECEYDDSPSAKSGQLALGSLNDLLACTSESALDGFYNLQVCRITYLSGISVVKATERYVRHFHHWLPVIDADLFERSLVKWNSGVPPADFSVMVMAIYLFSPPTDNVDIRNLYLLTRLLQGHLQALLPGNTSPNLIQTRVLLAAFEYACGNPRAALISISNAARLDSLRQHTKIPAQDLFSDDRRQEAQRNTTLSIIILERLIVLELPNPAEHYFSTSFPSEPISIPATASGDFARLVHATAYLDKLFTILRLTPSSVQGKIHALVTLDGELLVFLNAEIESKGHSHHSDAIATATRTLYLLHENLVELALGQCQQRSQRALDTMARMILEAVQEHSRHCKDIEGICLSSRYNLEVPVRHAERRGEEGEGVREARKLLEAFRMRWKLAL